MFTALFDSYNWEEVKVSILGKTANDVERALARSKRSLEDFKALISPAAAPYLEEMARQSQELTRQRFGRTIQMYVPLYLSNACQNICTYCAFSLDNKIPRKTLDAAGILAEAAVIRQMGYEHVLLVTGEANLTVGVDYLQRALRLLKPHFSQLSMEVQPLDQSDYEVLIPEGLHAVLVYQETYHRDNYRKHHPKGKKSNFNYRLETPDRLGKANVHRIGLGTLIGLEDWRTDCFFTALHLRYLEKTYWQTRFSVSFPRLRPIELEGQPSPLTFDTHMSDRELVQLICAWRLFSSELEISLSTREEQRFRDHVIGLGVTSISAGSRTSPGGYTAPAQELGQFEISDERSPAEIAEMIRKRGYEPVWKDWDRSFLTQT
ncbi:2-iminoacetate synthase ThiH [Pedobacter yulinensis]|uniref:2-iminoacetate synthase ThiH n=1 Tax=Pedobacter yulinensis TaxID=2126353 RepID=A0A2T3HKT5_9SPHI|nr:2-iminoacetate synthase ThiH [Pedobacter yulinensis]PST83057.1 2-iminoacetate synthase ThiH [Pedobacter yulinensis]